MSIYSDIWGAVHDNETLTGAGAVSVATAVTFLVTTGADALTLANGEIGQLKGISMKTDGGVGTLTPTNLNGYTTIAFDDVGDWVILKFNGLEWEVKGSRGVTLA